MPKKSTGLPEQAAVSGKTFTWTTEDNAVITIPLRIRMKLIRSMAGRDLDAEGMFDFLDAIIPDQADVLDDMDVNDFQAMFKAWQTAYNSQQEATLGEASGSSS